MAIRWLRDMPNSQAVFIRVCTKFAKITHDRASLFNIQCTGMVQISGVSRGSAELARLGFGARKLSRPKVFGGLSRWLS